MTVRYATVHLAIESSESMPPASGMYGLLKRLGLTTRTQESFWVIAYDAAMMLRTVVEINKGSYAQTPIHMPSLYTAVLASGSDRFQVAHNHPSNNVQPTAHDINTTQAIMAGANTLGLFFEDHHIVGPNGQHYSFAANKLLVPAPYTGEMRS